MAKDIVQPMGGSPDLDTFDNPAPVEVAESSTPIQESTGVDSFINLGLDTFDTPVEAEEPVAKKEKDGSQTDNIDTAEKVEKDDSESKEEKEPEAETEAEGKEGEGDDKSSEDSDPNAEKVKHIVAKRGDTKVEIPEDAVLRVAVDGKKENVTVRELMNDYSGRVAYDKKFSELDTERKEFVQEKEAVGAEKTQILEHLANMVEMIENPDGSPEDAVAYLLDLTGKDSYSYKKAFFENMADEFEEYSEMDDVEKRLFWAEKKNDYLEKTRESSTRRQQAQTHEKDLVTKVDHMREAHGVSEDDFVQGYEDLIDNGAEKPTPEQVIHYVKILPRIATAEEMLEPYQSRIDEESYEEVVKTVANSLLKGFGEADIAEELRSVYGEDEDEIVRTLNRKVANDELDKSQRKATHQNPYEQTGSEEDIESFNQFEY